MCTFHAEQLQAAFQEPFFTFLIICNFSGFLFTLLSYQTSFVWPQEILCNFVAVADSHYTSLTREKIQTQQGEKIQ